MNTPFIFHEHICYRILPTVVYSRDGLEDPLEDLGMVSQQLEQLSVIGQYQGYIFFIYSYKMCFFAGKILVFENNNEEQLVS